jgi:hypothetical protein
LERKTAICTHNYLVMYNQEAKETSGRRTMAV